MAFKIFSCYETKTKQNKKHQTLRKEKKTKNLANHTLYHWTYLTRLHFERIFRVRLQASRLNTETSLRRCEFTLKQTVVAYRRHVQAFVKELAVPVPCSGTREGGRRHTCIDFINSRTEHFLLCAAGVRRDEQGVSDWQITDWQEAALKWLPTPSARWDVVFVKLHIDLNYSGSLFLFFPSKLRGFMLALLSRRHPWEQPSGSSVRLR